MPQSDTFTIPLFHVQVHASLGYLIQDRNFAQWSVSAIYAPMSIVQSILACFRLWYCRSQTQSIVVAWAQCAAPSAGAIRTTESPVTLSALIDPILHPTRCVPRTKSISLCFLTVLTRGSWPSSSSSATNIVSSTSPITRLQCES
jgi:hypothetical protein